MSETSASVPNIAFPEDESNLAQFVIRFLLAGGLRVNVAFADGSTRPGYVCNLDFIQSHTTLLAQVRVDKEEPGKEPVLILAFINLEGEVTALPA